jgi:hypothetical protein
VPAEKLTGALTVMVEPLSPNVALLLFEKVIADKLLLVVPPLTLKLYEAVNVLPFNPKLTLLLLLKTMFVKFPLVVPALKLIGELIVIVEPFNPKVALLELLNVIALMLLEVVPPLTFIAVIPPPPEGTEIITSPFEYPTLATPTPLKVILRASAVPDETEEVVLLDIYNPIV